MSAIVNAGAVTVALLMMVAGPYGAGVEAAELPHPLDLDEVGITVPGAALTGFGFDPFHTSISGAGDANGDGFADFVVGADDGNESWTYVVFGGAQLPSRIDASSLNGANGVRIRGASWSVSGAGDVNADGLDDVLMAGSGRTYLVFGAALRDASGTLDLEQATEDQRFLIRGRNDESVGFNVSGAGDVNGDGIADILIGAPDCCAYLIFGSARRIAVNGLLDLETAAPGVAVRLSAPSGVFTGYVAGGAGDVDGDGYADLLIADDGATFGNASSTVYVVYGGPGIAESGAIDLSVAEGVFRITGASPVSHDGANPSVAGIGDFNGDGLDDLAIPSAGESVYIVFGRYRWLRGTSLDLDDDGSADQFLRLEGLGTTFFGPSVGGAGDVNGDGVADLLVGLDGDELDAPYSYVLYGQEQLIPELLPDLSKNDLDGQKGFRITGRRSNGHSVSGAGDVNGDGNSDFLVSTAESAYVIFGSEGSTIRTYRSFVGPGRIASAPIAAVDVGIVRDGSLTTPLSQCAIGFTGGSADLAQNQEGNSQQVVTLHRSQAPGFPSAWEPAAVYWRVETDRFDFSASELRLFYSPADVSGLDPEALEVYFTPSEVVDSSTDWQPIVFEHDAAARAFVVRRTHPESSAPPDFNGAFTIVNASNIEVFLEKPGAATLTKSGWNVSFKKIHLELDRPYRGDGTDIILRIDGVEYFAAKPRMRIKVTRDKKVGDGQDVKSVQLADPIFKHKLTATFDKQRMALTLKKIADDERFEPTDGLTIDLDVGGQLATLTVDAQVRGAKRNKVSFVPVE
jgi:hypothetical protein